MSQFVDIHDIPTWVYGVAGGVAVAVSTATVSIYHYVRKKQQKINDAKRNEEIRQREIERVTPRDDK